MPTSTVIRDEDDIARIIDEASPRRRMKAVWILGFGGIFVEAYSGASLASGLKPLTEQLGLGALQVSFVASSYLFVAILFATPVGRLADRIGRIPVILAGGVLALVSMIIAATAQNFEMLLVSRLFFGVSWACGFGVSLSYVSEFIPHRHHHRHSRWQGLWYVATTLNLLLAALTYQFAGDAVWRWMLGSAALIVAALIAAQFLLLPESPRWLASRGQLARAVNSLQKVYDAPEATPAADARSTGKGERTASPSLKQLFEGKYRKRIILGSAILSAHGMQYYAIGWYLPAIAISLFGDNFIEASLGSAAINLLGIVGGFSAAWIGSKMLVRTSAKIGFGSIAVIFLILGAAFDVLPAFWAIALPALFLLLHSAFTAAPAPRILTLSYPGELRAAALGVATTANNTAGAIGLFLFPLLQSWLGDGGAIMAMALCPLAGFAITMMIKWDPDKTSEADWRSVAGAAADSVTALDGRTGRR